MVMLDVSLPVQQLMPIALLISGVWRRQLLRISVMADGASTPGSRAVVLGRPPPNTSHLQLDMTLESSEFIDLKKVCYGIAPMRFTKWNEVKIDQLCLTLCDPMDCSMPGSSVHGILQARILEWVPFSRGSSQPRDQTQVSHIAG